MLLGTEKKSQSPKITRNPNIQNRLRKLREGRVRGTHGSMDNTAQAKASLGQYVHKIMRGEVTDGEHG